MKLKMSKSAVYDTRFFTVLYSATDDDVRRKIRIEMARKGKFVSSIVIHELYHTSIAMQGRETAKIKVAYVKQDFEIIPVNVQIAEASAELRHKYRIPMGDSMIAATAYVLKAVCISDDQHIKQIREIETAWI
jgi:predicted nucleic acid-binding protein